MIKILENLKKNQISKPVIVAIASGLYPLIYLYNSNFTLLTSWSQFFFLIFVFILIPSIIFLFIFQVLKKFREYENRTSLVLTVLNLSVFVSLIIYSTYGLKKKLIAIALLVVLLLSFLLYKHLKKIITFQFLLALIGGFLLVPTIFGYVTYSSKWTNQPDNIEAVNFIKRPNIYVLQPDGYVNFSEMVKGNYNKDNSEFKQFLENQNFKLYPNFRSNYYTTLSSNSSAFGMKHHYYNHNSDVNSELLFARENIVGKNAVTSIFKNNNYKTFLILENSYLLVNRPNVEYDYCNISFDEMPMLANGFEFKKDINRDLELAIENNSKTNNFYFIEKIEPSHIATFKSYSQGKDKEREMYLERVDQTNTWLKEIIALINKEDKNSLIIIAADHGGFVGLEYSGQSHQKPKNRDDIYSIFSSILAIKWPDDSSEYDKDLNTSVNLFRVVFSYLSENKTYLNNLQEDKSYLIIDKEAAKGIYEVIDSKGNAVFKLLSD